MRCCSITLLLGAALAFAAEPPRNLSRVMEQGGLPLRVHFFEDFETDIEKRWWLRGVVGTNNVPPGLSASLPNRRACRATETKDFDDKQGDPTKTWKAVIFNPVPGPPMGPNTRLSFRYWLKGTGTLRVQIYSLSNNYHRHLTLTNLTQGIWQSATVDMTHARRPDGTGGPLAGDERIDDVQFYVTPDVELFIDEIVLYEAAPAGETRSFPKRIIFTGWFDTGQQGKEWPGDFEIVKHDPPLTWKGAKSVGNPQTNTPWIRVQLRGLRPLSEWNRLRFRHRLTGGDAKLRVVLANSQNGQNWEAALSNLQPGRWAEASVDFKIAAGESFADELQFSVSPGMELLVDDVLLYEPGEAVAPAAKK